MQRLWIGFMICPAPPQRARIGAYRRNVHVQRIHYKPEAGMLGSF